MVEAGLDMHFNIHTKIVLIYVDVPKLHRCVITQPVCDYREEHYLHLCQVLASLKCQQFGYWVITPNTSEKMCHHCQASVCATFPRMVFLISHSEKSKMDPEEAGAERVRLGRIECS